MKAKFGVEYRLILPKVAMGICLFVDGKFINPLMTVYSPNHEKNKGIELMCKSLNESLEKNDGELNDLIEKMIKEREFIQKTDHILMLDKAKRTGFE